MIDANHVVKLIRGFKPINEVHAGDRVCTFNRELRTMEFQDVIEVVQRVVSIGEVLFKLENTRVHAVCDALQTWFVYYKRESIWREHTAQFIATDLGNWQHSAISSSNTKCSIPVAARNANPEYNWPDLPFMDGISSADRLDWCRLIGFIVGDGGVLTRYENGIPKLNWGQSTNKQDILQWLDNLIARLRVSMPDIFNDNTLRRWDPQISTIVHYELIGNEVYNFMLPMTQGLWGFNPRDYAAIHQYNHSWWLVNHRLGINASDALFNNVVNVSGEQMQLGRWYYLRRCLIGNWQFSLDVRQARGFLEGFAAADGEMDRLRSALDDTLDNPTVVPFKKNLRVCTSSLTLAHSLLDIATLAECRPTITGFKPAGINPTHFANRATFNANAAKFDIGFYLERKDLFVGLPRTMPFTVTRPATVYSIRTANGNYMAARTNE